MNFRNRFARIIATILCLFVYATGNVRADEPVTEEPVSPEIAVEESVDNDLESLATLSVSDLGALFKALTDGLSGPLIDDLRGEIAEASETYDRERVFSGSNPDGTQTWSGEVKYYPIVSIFDAQVTVNANDFIVDDVDNLALNGSLTIRIAGFWNPLYNGLTSLGFPYITYFSVDGEMASSGFMEEELTVHLLIDGTRNPLEVQFVINGYDIMAELQAAAEEATASADN